MGEDEQPGRGSYPAWWPTLVSLVGLGIGIYETVFAQADRPYLLLFALFLIMGGTPAQLLDAYLGRRNGR